MRTTLQIEDDILQAAKELAHREGSSTGKIISGWARRGLASHGARRGKPGVSRRNGVPLLPSRGEVVTLEKVKRLIEKENI